METLRTLGFPESGTGDREEARLLEECGTCVLRYLQAWQSGNWEREAAFFSEVVNYYDDQNVGRDFIRKVRQQEKSTLAAPQVHHAQPRGVPAAGTWRPGAGHRASPHGGERRGGIPAGSDRGSRFPPAKDGARLAHCRGETAGVGGGLHRFCPPCAFARRFCFSFSLRGRHLSRAWRRCSAWKSEAVDCDRRLGEHLAHQGERFWDKQGALFQKTVES